MRKSLFGLILLAGVASAVSVGVSPSFNPCTTGSALIVLIPGAQWTMQNDNYGTFAFVGSSTFTAPSQAAVNAQIATCQANQTQLAAEQVELSTTTQALSTLYPSLLTNPTTNQINQAVIFNSRLDVIRNDLGL